MVQQSLVRTRMNTSREREESKQNQYNTNNYKIKEEECG